MNNSLQYSSNEEADLEGDNRISSMMQQSLDVLSANLSKLNAELMHKSSNNKSNKKKNNFSNTIDLN
jgi:hypothetical protein